MKQSKSKRIVSLLLSVALLMGVFPLAMNAMAAPVSLGYAPGYAADPSTADAWEHMMGTDSDGNRYAGRVWVDKSVFLQGDRADLGNGTSFEVKLDEGEDFQVVFSALGSTMSSTSTVTTTGPMDVVLILDTSTSMDDEAGGVTRLERVIRAANTLLKDLTSLPNARIAIVTYNADSETVLPLAAYANGLRLEVTNYYNNGRPGAGVVTAYDNNSTKLGNDNGYTSGTNLQAGIDRGFRILADATDVQGRAPVAIVLTDGQANRANQASFYHNITGGNSASGSQLYLSTLLNAAYNKTKVEAHYGAQQVVYGIGVDLGNNTTAKLLMNPGSTARGEGFNASNSDRTIRDTYADYLKWADGQTVSYRLSGWGGSGNWVFDHNYPTVNGAVTREKISANINYVDAYYDVSAAQLEDTFHQIYEELSSGAFNPISSSTFTEGATGTDNTPLIFVDFIGPYMQIKDIQAVSLFGATYNVLYQNGSYVVETATGTNPTTKEAWSTADDIRIAILEEADGTQKLEIRINQEILPILMERVESETVGDVTTATMTEVKYEPLRIFYTVGMDSRILLPNGEVDVTKLRGYPYLNDANGTVTFYAGEFGNMNGPDADGTLLKGDSHVGFQPSDANRYYYHQSNQSIFTGIIDDATGKPVTIPENNEYGLVWDESKYSLIRMSYEDYKNTADDARVYTYVTYWHPTPSQSDAAGSAEEVTYLIYADWKYMKESVGFVDANSGKYLNDGKAIPSHQVEAVVSAYLAANPNAELYAVLGMGSLRTSRLHNMTVVKSENVSGTATESYAPEYTHEIASQHHGNDVVVWLGNNARRTVEIATGIALTKNLTEDFGKPEDRYPLTVTVPAGVVAAPVVKDASGHLLDASLYGYANNVLTVFVKAGETVYVSGIPAGTVCTVGEDVPADAEYYVADQSATVTVPALSEVLNGAAQYAPVFVTNAPYKYGNLFMTKEMESDHSIPVSVRNESFPLRVDLGTALAGESFSVLDSTHAAPYEVTVAADGSLSFSVKSGQTVEILRLPAGITATVTEQSPDAHFEVSYRSRNHSGAAPDADGSVVIPETGSATVVVTNTYTPDATSVDLDVAGTKSFVAPSLHNGGTFHFKVQAYNGSAWVDVSGKTASVSYAAGESGDKSFVMENVLEGVIFERVGEYAYRVLEVKGNVENVTYDRTLFTFDVTVTDNGGQLVATVTDRDDVAITDGSYEVIFHNSYNTAPVSVDIEKKVENLSGDTTVPLHGFAFEAVATDALWQPLSGAEASTLTVHSDAAGKARLSAVYDRVGTYYYVLKEGNVGAAGWSYSEAAYRITVTVVADADGKLTASLSVTNAGPANAEELGAVDPTDATKATVRFVNRYDPEDVSVDLDGVVKKELTGKSLEEDEFTFYVYADGDRSTPILVGTNDAGGTVSFVDFDKALLFDKVGKYAFDVVESIPTGAVYDARTDRYVLHGMSYDPTIYDLVVEVRNDLATGKLVADFYFEDAVENTVTFRNSYKSAPTAYTIGGTKLLHGRALKDGEFTFELYEGKVLVQSVSNKSDGSFVFDTVSYSAPGTYTYTVKEKAGSLGGVSYDSKEYTLTVTVTDINGALRAVADVANESIVFENHYAASPAELNILVYKTLFGAENDLPADGDFSFRLYQTDLSFDPAAAGATLVEEVKNQDGKATLSVSFTTPGTYFFVALEDASAPLEGVVYDQTQYRYVVQVDDRGDGQLFIKVSDLNRGNEYNPTPHLEVHADFYNALENQVAEKEVYTEGVSIVQIDGKKVEVGEILTYYLTYNNYNGFDVTVDILDAIPDHTSYVEGSATHGGTFAGDHVNWVLRVARGESVTVSFQVKVDETEAVVANTAIMVDGVNTYHTNEVVNHTVENELKKDVFYASDSTVSIDGQEVKAEEELLYEITFVNASAEEKTLEIRDVIPAHVSYVEGSADNGGVYADGAITWTLEKVPAWGSVTVSFVVKVNADAAAVSVENQATAEDGVNRYESNWVKNPVAAPEPPETTAPPATSNPPASSSSAPATSNPPATSTPPASSSSAPVTGDSSNFHWGFLVALSGGGLAVSVLGARKKKEQE